MSHRLRSWAVRAPLVLRRSVGAIGILLPATPVRAAKVATVGSQHPVTSPEERAALQRVIEQNAPVLEAQAAVVKAVAKLVGPTVVHIEADVPRQTLQYAKEPAG